MMDPSGLLTQLAGRLRVSALVPSLAMGVELRARLCTSAHVPIYYAGMERDQDPVHIDVVGRLWNRGGVPAFTVFEALDAAARGQDLRTYEGGFMGAFPEVTLESNGRREDVQFRLNPPEGETLAATAGDHVSFRFRTNRPGRRRRVRVPIEPTRE